MNPQLELLASQLKSCMDQTLHIASGVPESARCTQLKPGKAHPLWLIGHLANTINLLLLHWTLQVEGVVPKEYRKKFAPDFGGGDPVTPDPADYPAWDEVVSVYEQSMKKAIEGLATLTDADLANPVPGRMPDPLRSHFSSIGVTLSLMVGHDSYHRGQIGLLSALAK